ncbi:MAG: hypothetical protein ACP5G7_06850 [Anaerolineae bacterium]
MGETGETVETGAVRQRVANIAWVGVLLVVVVLALLTVFAVRYATTVDTMRTWIEERGVVVGEIPQGAAEDVAVGQVARVRVAGDWHEGRVAEVSEEAMSAKDEGDNGEGRYVRVGVVLDADGVELPTDEPFELRIITGWRLP